MKIEVCCREFVAEFTPLEGGSVVCRCGQEWHAGRTPDGVWRWFAVVPRDYSDALEEWKKEIAPLEYVVLAKLAERPGKVVAREELMAALWPDYWADVPRNALSVLVSRLRDQVDDRACIHTKVKVGYWLERLSSPERVR